MANRRTHRAKTARQAPVSNVSSSGAAKTGPSGQAANLSSPSGPTSVPDLIDFSSESTDRISGSTDSPVTPAPENVSDNSSPSPDPPEVIDPCEDPVPVNNSRSCPLNNLADLISIFQSPNTDELEPQYEQDLSAHSIYDEEETPEPHSSS